MNFSQFIFLYIKYIISIMALNEILKNLKMASSNIPVLLEGEDTYILIPICFSHQIDEKTLSTLDYVLFNNIVYIKEKKNNLKNKIFEIISKIKKDVENNIGEKNQIINFYSKIKEKEMIDLINDGIIFSYSPNENALFAMKYLESYIVTYNNMKFKFPSAILKILIFSNGEIEPDVYISSYDDEKKMEIIDQIYLHPFVYNSIVTSRQGQKICLGTFNNSEEIQKHKTYSPIQKIKILFYQAKQILIGGYHENVRPANNHLNSSLYDKFKINK